MRARAFLRIFNVLETEPLHLVLFAFAPYVQCFAPALHLRCTPYGA